MRSIVGTPTIRELSAQDSMARLTKLIHAAYAPHAAQGLRFWGTHQTEEESARRFAAGRGLVAEFDGEYVGTVIARPPQPESLLFLYRLPDVWSISQLAVAPQFKGRGLGRALHNAAEVLALANGAAILALDTATPAQALIAMYEAWGYRVVGNHDWWPHTNFLSTVMSRPIKAIANRVPFHRADVPKAASRPLARRSCPTLGVRRSIVALQSVRKTTEDTIFDLR